MVNVNPFLIRVKQALEAHRVDLHNGYRRNLNSSGNADLYGTADAAIILYTLGELPVDEVSRQHWIDTLQSFQSSKDGLFQGEGHHAIHGTAFVVSTLELLAAKPRYPLTALEYLKDPHELNVFLSELNWKDHPWGESQQGSGLYAALVLNGSVDEAWEDLYFDWLWEQADPVTGLWKKGEILDEEGSALGAPLFHHVAGSFHYLFNLDYRKRKIRYPEQWMDTCLTMYKSRQLLLSEQDFSFNELDLLYTFIIVMAQTDHRADECQAMISHISDHFLEFIERKSEQTDSPYEDLHSLCGAVCALAIVQSQFPEKVVCDRTLQKVLDRRPFI